MKDYIKEANKTATTDFEDVTGRLKDKKMINLLHSVIGLCTESGEIQDQLKKHIFYGTALDEVNLIEELGDIFWYLALMANELGVSFDEIQKKNIEKLKKRYGGKFEKDKAMDRDLKAERKILEGDK